MKNLILFILIVLLTAACTKQNKVPSKMIMDNNTVLIDVRTKTEFSGGHLEKAINIPYTEIEEKINNITKDTDQHIVLYCRSGRRSGIAQQALMKMGYKNVHNGGSYKDLIKQQSK